MRYNACHRAARAVANFIVVWPVVGPTSARAVGSSRMGGATAIEEVEAP